MIDKLCIEKYNELKLHRHLKDNEWTVLAGIVLQVNDRYEAIVLAYPAKIIELNISTGTKCIPVSKIDSTGGVLHDCHAEVLARRAFMVYIYDHLEKAKNESSKIFNFDGLEYTLKPHVMFHLYVSYPPSGGDCSIRFLEKTIKGLDECKYTEVGKVLVKGHKDFSLNNVLRFKPGRIDGEPCISMSCTDKITRWNILGCQGALLYEFVGVIRFHSITVGGTDEINEVMRCLNNRVSTKHPISCFLAENTFDYSKSSFRSLPSPISSNWNLGGSVENIVNGRRQGFSVNKLTGKFSDKANSRLSKRKMFQLYCDVREIETDFRKYKYYKTRDMKYAKYREFLFNELLYRPWIKNELIIKYKT